MSNTSKPQEFQTADSPRYLGSFQQRDSDELHLKLLSIFYYIVAALTIMGAVSMFFMMGFFSAIIDQAMAEAQETDPDVINTVKTIVFAVLMTVGILTLLKGLLQLLVARNISKRKGRILCFLGAILTVIDVPLGTILGIFSFVVLARQTVKALFDGKSPEEIYADAPVQANVLP